MACVARIPAGFLVVCGLEGRCRFTKDIKKHLRAAFSPHNICQVKLMKNEHMVLVKFQKRSDSQAALSQSHYLYQDEMGSAYVYLQEVENSKESAVAVPKPRVAYGGALTCDFSSVLGEGSFGSVYSGTFHGAPVAIKVLKDKDKALKEAQMSFDHPNLVTLLAIGECPTSPQIMLVLERMLYDLSFVLYPSERVGQLASICVPPLTYPTKLKISEDVAQGLRYLHDLRIVHRDLKPDNIMLDAHMNAKLGDMGSCLPCEDGVDTVSMDEPFQGTAWYTAPEVLSGSPASIGSDVHSFGVVLLEIFSETKPYGNTKTSKVISAVISGRHAQIPRSWPSDLAAVISSCLKTANKRPTILVVLESICQIRNRTCYTPTTTTTTTSTTEPMD
ncbi:serine/threonine kinase [Pelomyxa schiedti]|nr:serine/threonine kinase [Pelomyxa schiedti]